MKKILIVFRWIVIGTGGIETYIYKETKKLLGSNYEVIIEMPSGSEADKSFSDIINEKNVTFLYPINANAIKEYCQTNNIEEIKIISFDLFSFAESEKIKKKLYKLLMIDNFIFIPHFKGDTIYLEEAYAENKKNKAQKRLSLIWKKLCQNDCVKFFSFKHIETLRNKYNIDMDYDQKNMVPKEKNVEEFFDYKKREQIYDRQEFRIISALRFEFPHKGFIIGLVKKMDELRKIYPELTLMIVGEGNGKEELLKTIEACDSITQKAIMLHDSVNPDELNRLFDDADLNISLAGCATIGARRGVPTLPARHYTREAEVYGWIFDNYSMTLSEEEGESPEKYIKELISMDKEEYMEMCRKTKEISDIEAEKREGKTFEELKTANNNFTLSKKDIRYILKYKYRKYGHYWAKIKRKLKLVLKI